MTTFTSVEAWVIDCFKRLDEQKRQESQYEQLQLPLYDEPPCEQKRPDTASGSAIVIEL